ncbi:hypothetical protein [Bosea minatitlanensis]|uniref:Uncharacterized protein n=1 Tax=Bosea minatitlanensis TaxID=128782 RepID=A0ABW0F348_9HYPH|nr:hypothetical protein [Bosea minatitlanensis]MCT4492997.1 hypothetical protein [Bosea minatitlanensis]
MSKLGIAEIRALQFLRAKHDKNPNAPYGWHMPSQRTARACRASLERKGLVAIERLSPTHFRYHITEAGRSALSTPADAKEKNDG